MKNIMLSVFCFIISASVFPGCSADPNEKANELYVEASQLMQCLNKEAGNYSEELALYKSAQKKIEDICSKYPASNISVGLLSEQAKIAGLTLREFEELEKHLKPLAEAEKQLPSSTFLVGEKIGGPDKQKRKMADIEDKFVEFRQEEKPTKALTKAFNTAKGGETQGKGLEKAKEPLSIPDSPADPLPAIRQAAAEGKFSKKQDMPALLQKQRTEYTLQLASLENEIQAGKMTVRLTGQGYPAYYYRVDIKGKRFFRVRCGRFKDREEAGNFKKLLSEKQGLTGFVTKADKGEFYFKMRHLRQSK